VFVSTFLVTSGLLNHFQTGQGACLANIQISDLDTSGWHDVANNGLWTTVDLCMSINKIWRQLEIIPRVGRQHISLAGDCCLWSSAVSSRFM